MKLSRANTILAIISEITLISVRFEFDKVHTEQKQTLTETPQNESTGTWKKINHLPRSTIQLTYPSIP